MTTEIKTYANWDAVEDAFIDAVRETGNITAAARSVGASRGHAYLRRESHPDFARRWDEALEESLDLLESEARRRAERGTEKPVFYQGSECGQIQEYSDTLMIFLLKAHRPEKFRDKFEHQHAGAVRIEIEYINTPFEATDAPSGAGSDS